MTRRTLVCWLCGLLAASAVAAALPLRMAGAQNLDTAPVVTEQPAAEASTGELPPTPPATAAEPAVDSPAAEVEDFEILTRGPVHEAFAEPVTFDPQPGIVVPQAPPPAVEEVAPDQRPEGVAIWIPGYWAWSEDQNGYLWVSGIWRSPPPDYLEWVPGYWQQTDGGHQWISGYWGSLEADSVAYLPSPPASLEEGPSSEAPRPDCFWVPGCWLWREGHYVWRAGFWSAVQPRWVWVPAHYVWTPAGCVFVEGYWDRLWEDRGLLFAPVWYHRPVYAVHGYCYTPTIVIDTGLFTTHLFARAGYCHYYFGDYYDPIYYRSYGIYPCFVFHERHYGYDPIYAHCLWGRHGHDHDWRDRLVHHYERCRDDEDFRPPHTYNEQRHKRDRWRDVADDRDGHGGDGDRDFRGDDFDRGEFELAKDLNDGEVRKQHRLRDVSTEDREAVVRSGRAARAFEQRRSESESGESVAAGAEPRLVDRERSPLAREGDQERAKLRRAARLQEEASGGGRDAVTSTEGGVRRRSSTADEGYSQRRITGGESSSGEDGSRTRRPRQQSEDARRSSSGDAERRAAEQHSLRAQNERQWQGQRGETTRRERSETSPRERHSEPRMEQRRSESRARRSDSGGSSSRMERSHSSRSDGGGRSSSGGGRSGGGRGDGGGRGGGGGGGRGKRD